MLVDRSHRHWLIITATVSLVFTWLYLDYARSTPNGPRGGSWQGLIFGILGSLCMIYAGLLSGRKALPGARLGNVQFWMKGHLWIGLLSVPFIFFHSGFRFGGLLEQILMVCFLTVIVSGMGGLALQQILPRLMSVMVPSQAIAEQIPVACRRLRESVDATVLAVCSPNTNGESAPTASAYSPESELSKFYNESLRCFLASDPGPNHAMMNRTWALTQIDRLQGSMPERLQPAVEEMRAAYEERRQLMTQSRIQFWLHVWLFLHVPLSVALLVLGVVHAVTAVYY